ncbi:MAG: glutathione S-transferase family protein [Candidatus Obscuribacterales bacterium]|nr:glutathione S-transferase family protein [Steroidobacteraceae bacterium]
MSLPTLVIGTKNLSSWSLRPWLLLKHLGMAFEEIVLPLDTPEFYRRIVDFSPAGRVPVWIDNDLKIWDSLAICEYASELANGKGWPHDVRERAWARAIGAEMHSGFQALRSNWPMNALGRDLNVQATPQTLNDIARIDALWYQCRTAFADRGAWLFGEYSIADAMYAPVVLRFQSYNAKLSSVAKQYVATTLGDRYLQQWIAEA